jgi:hypothetical protein
MAFFLCVTTLKSRGCQSKNLQHDAKGTKMEPMHRTLLSLSAFVLFCIPFVASAATVASKTLTKEEQLLRVCAHVDSDHTERCIARQKARAKVEGGMSRPTGAFELYDGMDRGQNHLRARLQRMRAQDFARDVRLNRRTYAEFKPTEDLNTAKRPYVNDIRYQRLQCMYAPPGRQRNICLDELGNTARKQMQDLRGTNLYPAR